MKLRLIVNWLNKRIPKKNIVLFNSFPDISGNSWAVYCYIKRERPDLQKKYRLIWSVGKKEVYFARKKIEDFQKTLSTGHNKTEICIKKSIRGIWLYCCAQYFITTHNYFTGVNTTRDQKNINLWHGMPLKRIGKYLDDQEHDNIQADCTIATSSFFQKVMEKAFDLPDKDVWITGQPCNDVFFEQTDALFRLGIQKSKYEKIIIWMPTYRTSVVGEIRCDGDADGFGVVSLLRENIKSLNDLLKKKGYLLLIKPHPMDMINEMNLENSENLWIIRGKELCNKNVELYELLAETDVLMTDYSSVYVDYLLLKKPIAFFCNDMEAYEKSRGFCFPSIMELLPGEKIYNEKDFWNYLENLDDLNDRWIWERERICELFYQNQDNNSSKRVCERIFGKMSDECYEKDFNNSGSCL